MQNESIEIKNFGPIKDVRIDTVKPLTVLIGDSGSGKSTIMKLLALFQWIYKMSCVRSYLHYSGITKSPFRFRFESYLKNNGLDDYLQAGSEIVYTNGTHRIAYNKETKLQLTPRYVPMQELSLEKVVFISDQRGMIPELLQNGGHLANNYYLFDTYENYKRASEAIKTFNVDYLGVKLQVKKTPHGEKHEILPSHVENGNYSVELSHSSSGTKNVVPLNLIVEYFSKHYDLVETLNRSILSYVSQSDNLKAFKAANNVGEFPNKRVSLLVEEPELSLFPSAQLGLMDFLMNRCFVQSNKGYNISLMLATHSPYIVNYLNVLIRRRRENPTHIDGDKVAVYRVYDGKLQNLMQSNKENGMVSVNSADFAEPISEMLEEYRSLR